VSVTYNPFQPAVRLDPYPLYRQLREQDPVHYNEQAGIWFLTRHADCAFALRDDRFSAAQGQQARLRDDALPVSMLNSDPPAHSQLRAPVNHTFSARVVEDLRRLLEREAVRLVSGRTGQVDLIAEFAAPLATATLAAVLGVPPADLPAFQDWAGTASVNLDPFATPAKTARAHRATEELAGYLGGLVDRWSPGGVADVVTPQLEAGLSRSQIVNTLALLVIGGLEPLQHVIGNGVHTLLRTRGAWADLRSKPLRRAVDELLRFESPIQLTARVTTAEVEIGGVTIGEQQTVVLLLGAANHDPGVFPDPERLDLDRTPNPHLGFGGGIHFCLGAGLATVVAEAALATLLDRWPEPELSGPPPRWRNAIVPRGLGSLHVTL